MNHYRVTTVEPQPARRELVACLVRALPSLEWRHHGIGVLQAYIIERDPEVRVHIWHPDLARFGVEDEGRIHDHRFTLESSVLVGEIGHDEYHLRDDPVGKWTKFTVVNARRGSETPAPCEGSYSAEIIGGTISAGHVYTFPEGAFHRSYVDDIAVTLVTKHAQRDRRAMILVPKGYQPRHGFEGNGPVDASRFVEMARRALLGSVT